MSKRATPRRPRRLRRAFRRVVDFYWGEGIADDVPALTYYLVLSLAPFVLGMATVAAIILQSEFSRDDLTAEIARFTPPEIRSSLTALVERTQDESPLLLSLAVLAMLWTSSGAIGVIERCLARMVQLRRYNVVVGKIRNLALGGGVALLLVFTVAGTTLTTGLARRVGLDEDFVQPFVGTITILASIAVCMFIFHWCTRDRLLWRASLAGGGIAGIALQALPFLISLYVTAFADARAERIFFLLAAILFSFYMMAQILLIGAGLSAVIHRRVTAVHEAGRRTTTERAIDRVRRAVSGDGDEAEDADEASDADAPDEREDDDERERDTGEGARVIRFPRRRG